MGIKLLFVWPNKDQFGFKPLSISLLSAIAKHLSWDVRLFDTSEIDFGFIDNSQAGEQAKLYKHVDFSKYDLQKKRIDLKTKFLEIFNEFNPDVLALSVLSDEVFIAHDLSKIAKDTKPDVKIIWGGKYPTICPETTLLDHYADFVCICEGIEAFGELLTEIEEGKTGYDIKNIWIKDGSSIIRNPIRPLFQDLDNLPFIDWDIFDIRHFYKPFDGKIYISGDHMLNWGCPNHCSYCINHFYHEIYLNKYRMRRYGIKRIIDELIYLKEKYKLEFFKFHDEDFLMRPLNNFIELSKTYKADVDLPFVIETNPKTVTQEKGYWLKKMGCVSASLGIETGDAILREKLLKRVDTEKDIVNAFTILNSQKIRTCTFNMLAIPFETRETYEKTIELNRKANPQSPGIGFFYPFEGTEIREIAIHEGFFNPNNNIIFNREKPALNFSSLTEHELIQMRDVFVLYIKLPKVFHPYIKRSEITDDVGKKLRHKILKIYDNTVWENDGWYTDDRPTQNILDELEKIQKCS